VTHDLVLYDADGEPVSVTVRYTVTEAERACWRDADGDGHPGFDATAELIGVEPSVEWIEEQVAADWDSIEQEILDGLA
jgi:hypothetical protein